MMGGPQSIKQGAVPSNHVYSLDSFDVRGGPSMNSLLTDHPLQCLADAVGCVTDPHHTLLERLGPF